MSTIPAQQRAWSLLAGLAVSAGVYVAAQVRREGGDDERRRNRFSIEEFPSSIFSSVFFHLKTSQQRELYQSVARIVDSSSSAPKAPEKKVRENENEGNSLVEGTNEKNRPPTSFDLLS